MSAKVNPADWHKDQSKIRALRDQVFVREQKVPAHIEWDDQEATAQHFLLHCDGSVVGTGRITTTGKIGRMAILREKRGLGLGRQLLESICHHAQTRGLDQVYLHAQCHAEAFYRKCGFEPVGEQFFEAGIAHIKMVRRFV
ncbi:GNAT family N-acetyltransferase [Microbulbifer sp. 2201CG32-9]|uniref:GNAT family N-acetyltransferase n=1 Tax=Microbulbifer sp. 2201CG32-9 TaxID=3232309 RepID=UPI00345C21E4